MLLLFARLPRVIRNIFLLEIILKYFKDEQWQSATVATEGAEQIYK